ncbi:MAG TPA: LysE family translocator [Burkholderiales bacterium]|jgi:threonine/homoserine/homoserine lactone efflux protein|nr:LysE family translocator [Burkholderiales bacterium]
MPGTHDLLLFIVSGWLLNITPGPDMLYIIGRSTAQGLRAGIVAALGVGAGIFVHIAATALGLSAILAASAGAFTLIKLLGAAYLVYVGLSLLRSSSTPFDGARAIRLAPASLRSVFMQGFLTNVLNPKVALFFLAFLPQFVESDATNKPLAFLFLGLVFNVNGTLWNLFVAWSAARMTAGLRQRATALKWFNRCVGGIFVALGVRLALVHED